MTATADSPVILGAEFPPVDHEAWQEAVRSVLFRGKPDPTDDEAAAEFAKRLVTITEDGFEIQPLYTADDAPEPRPAPGEHPFVRGTHPEPRDWEIRQRVWPAVDESSALTELDQGATGVLLEVDGNIDAATLESLLEGVYLDLAPVSISTPGDDIGLSAARALLDVWTSRSVPTDVRLGTMGIDPIGAWARTGGAVDPTAQIADIASFVGELADSAPNARALVADGTVWHDAGATPGQELAWAISSGVAIVRAVIDAGVDTNRAFSSIEFRFAATADHFATITKLRAARLLWARIAEVSGADPAVAAMRQHADASRPMLTRYDPWVNALRSTVACFGAAVGGADAVTIAPHDLLLQAGGSTLGRRIARNTQSVLLLESNLARVVDMGGGSWYVERRTDDIATAAWQEIQRIEQAGGIVAAVSDGSVHAALADANEARSRAVATRRRPLTGLTEFPDIDEPPPPPSMPDASPLSAQDVAPGDTPFEPFVLRRLGDEIEAIRGRADRAERETGSRPTMFLAGLGGPAASTARATFAKNFFEAGGIRTVLGELDEFDASTTTFACLCSSDAVYAEQGQAAAQALRDRGATTVFVAGRGLDLDDVDTEIGIGSDLLAVLSTTLDDMGVAS